MSKIICHGCGEFFKTQLEHYKHSQEKGTDHATASEDPSPRLIELILRDLK